MAQDVLTKNEQISSNDIEIRVIGINDLFQALNSGFKDFNSNPHIILFLCIFYPLAALLITLYFIDLNLRYLAFPVVSGFALLGPVVLVGLYEMSRQREQGVDNITWRSAFHFIHTPSFPSIVALSVLMMFLYAAWLFMAQFIYFGSFSTTPPDSITEFYSEVLSTRQGSGLIFYGTIIGFIFAVVAFSISVVSYPLLLDKNVSARTAIATSINAVVTNRFVMAVWGLIVAALLVTGAAILLVGLVVVVPVLGHATWHLYRKLIK